mgnify:CR=1 FL=1
MILKQKHLLGLEGYPSEDIQTIIDTAFSFRKVLDRPIKKVPSLQGKTIANLFFELPVMSDPFAHRIHHIR